MDKLVTPTQRKNGTDRDLIIQTMMLILTNSENDFSSFRTKDIDTFIESHSEEALTKVDILKDAMDKFNEAFEEIKILITSIPMVLYSGYCIIKDKKSFQKLINIINEFLKNYDAIDEYKQFVLSGTGSSQNIKARLDWWRNKIRTA